MTEHSLSTILRDGPRYVLERTWRALVSQRLAWYFRRNPTHRAVSEQEATEAVRTADQILFLCLGNICRSPLAERYLRQKLTDGVPDGGELKEQNEAHDGLTVCSAGLGRYEGRQSPATAVEVARQYGVDLADHRSLRANRTMVENSDVVFVMDYNNYHSVVNRYPDAADKVFFLRVFTGGEPVIDDPHNTSAEMFEQVYDTVTGSVDNVAAVVRDG